MERYIGRLYRFILIYDYELEQQEDTNTKIILYFERGMKIDIPFYKKVIGKCQVCFGTFITYVDKSIKGIIDPNTCGNCDKCMEEDYE